MSLYRQPIILFGLVLPIIAGAALVGIASVLKSQVVDSFAAKEKNAKTAAMGAAAARAVEAQVEGQRPQMSRWTSQHALETKSSVNQNLKEIVKHLPPGEIIRTNLEPSNTKAGFGSASAQKSSQVSISFRGTLRTTQRALLELETRMPQLQLGELKIVLNAAQPPLLNFQVNYTAWEN